MQRHYFFPPTRHFDNRHGVVAEDVHHLDGHLAPPGRAFVKDAGQFQRYGPSSCGRIATRFRRCNRRSRPLHTPQVHLRRFHSWHRRLASGAWAADDLALALEVEIHGPVVDPVGPFLREPLAGDDAVLVLADLHDLALFHHDLAGLVFERRFGGGNGILRVEDGKIGQFHRHAVPLDVRLDLDVPPRRGRRPGSFPPPACRKPRRECTWARCRCPWRGPRPARWGTGPSRTRSPRISTRVMCFWRHSRMTSSTNRRVTGKLTGPTDDQPPGLLAVESGKAVGLFGAVGPQDQVEEGGFLFLAAASAAPPRAGWG